MQKSSFLPNILEGKVAFVTGGATGICYGIARDLLSHGCKVGIVSRNINNIEKAVAELKKITGSSNIVGTVCDVRLPQSIEKAVDYVLEQFGSIDVLVNGAAGNFLASIDQLSPNGFKTVIEIDTLGTYNTSKIVYEKAFKPNYQNKKSSIIINISATLHQNGTLWQSHAGSAKAAVDALTKHLAVELGPKKIRVVGVSPGVIQDTEGFSRLYVQDDKDTDKSEFSSLIPSQRYGTIFDISQTIVFLISNAAAYITGHTLIVDGGQSLTCPNFPLSLEKVQKIWNSKL